MKRKTWVYLGVLLLVLVPLAAQQGNLLQPRSSLTIYDSKGKVVGTVVETTVPGINGGAYPIPAVAFKSGQQITTVGVKPDHFVGNDSALFFGTSDCSGMPYFYFQGASLISRSFVTNDGTLYIQVAGTSVSTVNTAAAYIADSDFPSASTCYPYESPDAPVLEAQAVGNLNQMYQPPFVLK